MCIFFFIDFMFVMLLIVFVMLFKIVVGFWRFFFWLKIMNWFLLFCCFVIDWSWLMFFWICFCLVLDLNGFSEKIVEFFLFLRFVLRGIKDEVILWSLYFVLKLFFNLELLFIWFGGDSFLYEVSVWKFFLLFLKEFMFFFNLIFVGCNFFFDCLVFDLMNEFVIFL